MAFPKGFDDLKDVGRINIGIYLNTLRTGDADLRFYVTTVQDG